MRIPSLAAVLVLLVACGDDAEPTDGGGMDGGGDAGRADAGRGDAGSPPDTGAPDAAEGDDAGDRDAAGRDAGDRDAGDRDAGPLDCCSSGICPGRLFCDFETCRCFDGGCCTGAETCAPDEICDFDCRCGPVPVCEPACGEGFTCDFGECIPSCAFEGCPDPTHVCDFERGCTPPACTDAECDAAELLCDPFSGCYDPCEPADAWTWCVEEGGRCWRGGCVDDSCAAVGATCGYAYDCCGSAYCQSDSDPPPECPPRCGGVEDPPFRADLCACEIGGFCVDLRFGGFGPRPPPPPPPPF